MYTSSIAGHGKIFEMFNNIGHRMYFLMSLSTYLVMDLPNKLRSLLKVHMDIAKI